MNLILNLSVTFKCSVIFETNSKVVRRLRLTSMLLLLLYAMWTLTCWQGVPSPLFSWDFSWLSHLACVDWKMLSLIYCACIMCSANLSLDSKWSKGFCLTFNAIKIFSTLKTILISVMIFNNKMTIMNG